MAERFSKCCSKIDTTSSAEKEEKNVSKSPSCEINAENDLKTTIFNLPKQIRELKQERFSTSFQNHRFNSNPLRLEKDLPSSYPSHSQKNKTFKKSDLY